MEINETLSYVPYIIPGTMIDYAFGEKVAHIQK